jgi:biopolymer transport protein ExbB
MNLVEWLQHLMTNFGATWVMWLMIALSVASVTIMLERGWFYYSIRDDIPGLAQSLRDRLRNDDVEAALGLLEKSPSAEAAVVVAGLREADRGVKAADKAMRSAAALQKMKLERRLAFLGTLGNNAPFVGLLGTVIGVVGAFEELGKPQALSSTVAGAASLAPERVMGTIAEALVATAVGLVVAIPVVAIFNYFQGRVGAALADAETLGHVLLAHLRSNPGSEPERPSAATSMAAEDVASDLPLPDVADAIAE